jgi:hypothetical protein
VFGSRVRRSGSLRSIWYRRERKRRPLNPHPVPAVAPRPVGFGRWVPTEAAWLSDDPRLMIGCVVRLATDRGIVFHLSQRAVERKFQLFYCACCRLCWELLPDSARRVVELVEECATRHVSAERRRNARRTAEAAERAARPVYSPGGYPPGAWDVNNAVRLATAATSVQTQMRLAYLQDGSPVSAADQVVLLRELFDNPFRQTALPREWFTQSVVGLSRVILAERAFDLMPVLGDALQDAGCTCSDILDRCYGSGPRIPGCWLLDRLSAPVTA